MACHNFLKNLGNQTKICHCLVVFHVILIECRLFNIGKTRADLECGEKEPSDTNKLAIDAISVTTMLIQIFHQTSRYWAQRFQMQHIGPLSLQPASGCSSDAAGGKVQLLLRLG